MQVIFIRHGSAEPVGQAGDAARGLTDAGRREVRATCQALKALDVRLQRVLSSPLTRAIQTAGLVAEAFEAHGPDAVGFLVPPGDFQEMTAVLADMLAEEVPAVGLVGHSPSLGELLVELIGGRPCGSVSLSNAGAACVALAGDQKAELRWLMQHSQLALLAPKA